jgi:hypothetical protein
VTANRLTILSVSLIALLCTSCDDSKTPLSDPQQSKPDAGLVGSWRYQEKSGQVLYYHIGRIAGKLPPGVMRLIGINFSKEGNLESPAEMLLFPTQIGDRHYLNAAGVEDPEKLKAMEEKGWTPQDIGGYWLVAYRLEKDAISVWPMDAAAKKRAIESGKVKGEISKGESGFETVRFTDTSENLARFVAEAGDTLFAKEPMRLERIK